MLLTLLLLSAAGTGFSLWMPRLQGGFVDALRTSDWNIARHYIVWLIVVLAGSLLLGYIQPLVAGKYFINVTESVISELVAILFAKPASFFRHYEAGYIVPRILSEVNALQPLYGASLISIVFRFVTFAGAVVLMFQINVFLTIICLALTPLYLVVGKVFTSPMERAEFQQKEAYANLSDYFVSDYNAGLLLKVIGAVPWSVQRILKQSGNFFRSRFRSVLVHTSYSAFSGASGSVAPIIVLIIGGASVAKHQMTIGQLFEYLGYLSLVFAPFNSISMFYRSFVQARVVLDRLVDLLGNLNCPDLENESGARCPIESDEQIRKLELLQLGFNLEDRPLFEGVSVQLNPGDALLIKGDSGAGKTTLLEMIVGLQTPTNGSIRYNGRRIDQVSQSWVISRVAYVSATSPLIRGTVVDNILLGLRDVGETDVLDALKQVRLIEKIQSLPAGIHTDTNDPSVSGLSQGERQRLAIVRALLKNPDLLILDEATSNLDEASEKKIMELIQQLFQDKMMIVVSHHYKPYFNANKFIELGAGLSPMTKATVVAGEAD